jgi:hypothetical protein
VRQCTVQPTALTQLDHLAWGGGGDSRMNMDDGLK